MMLCGSTYLIIATFLLVLAVARCEREDKGEVRTITSPQYCGGCQQTVEILGRLASQGVKDMENRDADQSDTLDMTKLSNGLCSRQEFKKFQPFVEDSCIKLLHEHKYHILNVFTGHKSALFSSIRGNLFQAKREACVNETQACPPQLFSPNTTPAKERSKCNACFEVSKDVEALKFVLKEPSNNFKIIDEICENIASNHLPYSWIETKCDEIVEDYSDEIVAALDRRDKLKLNPFSSPFSKIVCTDILGCSSPPWEEHGNAEFEL